MVVRTRRQPWPDWRRGADGRCQPVRAADVRLRRMTKRRWCACGEYSRKCSDAAGDCCHCRPGAVMDANRNKQAIKGWSPVGRTVSSFKLQRSSADGSLVVGDVPSAEARPVPPSYGITHSSEQRTTPQQHQHVGHMCGLLGLAYQDCEGGPAWCPQRTACAAIASNAAFKCNIAACRPCSHNARPKRGLHRSASSDQELVHPVIECSWRN